MPPRRGQSLDHRKLIRGGAPAFLSSIIAALVPAAGVLFLDTRDYAIWALAATLTTIFLIVDFGTTGLTTKLAAERNLSKRALRVLASLTSAPPLFLTALTLAIWPAYSSAANLGNSDNPKVLILILMVGIGTTLRSLGLISAAAALGRNEFGARSSILLGGAVIQAVVTLALLATGVGFMSLGIGVVAGGTVQAVLGSLLERADAASIATQPVWPLVRRFATSRGAAVLFGVAITQLDRWSLGLFASAAVLTVYDIAIRFATMPKIALLAFGGGLVTEASGTPATGHVRVVFSTYTRIYSVLAGACVVPAAAIAIWIGENRTGLPLRFLIILVAMTVLAHAVNAATIPASFIGMGLGRPALELVYLGPLVVLCMAGYWLGNVTGLPLLQVALWATAMIVCSVIFIVVFPRLNHWGASLAR